MPSYHPSQPKKDIQAVAIGGVLVLLVGVFFIGRLFWGKSSEETIIIPKETSEDIKKEEAPSLSADVIRQKIYNGEKITLLDVRDQASFEAEHIPHSRMTSAGALSSLTAGSDEIIIIIHSENDTVVLEAVTNILKTKSFPIFLITGGFEEWKKTGNQTISRGNPESFIDQSKVTYVTPAEALKLLTDYSAGYFLLDIQEKNAFERKHLKGAAHIPLSELEKRYKEIPAGRNIVVYGENELESFRGGVRLADLGLYGTRTLSGNDHLKPESIFKLEP
jgi:rhodanese-related sulfurtransferase